MDRSQVKRVLGGLPLAAELDWALRHKGSPVGELNLEDLKAVLPTWVEQAAASPLRGQGGKRVLVFATLTYWLEQGLHMALALAGMGHQVTFGYLPYASWRRELSSFDARRAALYAGDAFAPAAELVELAPFLEAGDPNKLPADLLEIGRAHV